jgi:hypothetical protein
VGPMPPPVTDLPRELRRLAAAGREISVGVDRQVEWIVSSLIAETAQDAAANISGERG